MGWMINPGYRSRRYRRLGSNNNSSSQLQGATSTGLITRNGRRLMRNGKEFVFTGVNIYNANSDGNYSYNLATGDLFAQALQSLGSSVTIVRAWFGQWLARPKSTNGQLTWSYFDHTLNTAHKYGKQVIVVLADQDGSWCDGIKKTYESNWYQYGYRTLVSPAVSHWGTRNAMTYKDFAVALVSRYKDHPGVAFWQLINEAEIRSIDKSRHTPELEDKAATVIRDWANDMAATIKAVDPKHLISLGTIGTGQFGTSSYRYETIHSGPNIDLLEMHDYEPHSDIIGDSFNGMDLRMRQAARLNKPLFIGEVGIKPDDVGGAQARADRLRSKIRVQRARGVVGHVVWDLRNDKSAVFKGDDYDITPNDPMMNALRSM